MGVMKRNEKTIAFTVAIFFAMLSGCATVSHVLNPPQRPENLLYDEEDVLRVIEELTRTEPGDKDAVHFDGERYCLRPDVYKKAVRDGVIKRVQERKIQDFLAHYDRQTIADAFKKDIGTMGLLMVILLAVGVFL
jgi:hypothetical protein